MKKNNLIFDLKLLLADLKLAYNSLISYQQSYHYELINTAKHHLVYSIEHCKDVLDSLLEK